MTTSRALLSGLLNTAEASTVIAEQTRRETYAVLCGPRYRALVQRSQAQAFVRSMTAYVRRIPSDLIEPAWRIENETNFRWWDCLMLAAARTLGADIFLSEDLNHGQRIGDMTIRNPFLETLQES